MEIDVSEIAEQIFGDIESVANAEEKNVEELVAEIAKESCALISERSPVEKITSKKSKRRTGIYKRGWKAKEKQGSGGKIWVVSNPNAGLAEMLENGTGDRITSFGASRGKIKPGKFAHIRRSCEEAIAKHKL